MTDPAAADRAAILAVIEAETTAYLARDFETWSRCWVQAAEARRLTAKANGGAYVDEGWLSFSERMRTAMQRHPVQAAIGNPIRRDRISIVVGADMAWVTYDQQGVVTGDAFDLPGIQHELKILHKVDGTWKIACLVVMQRSVDHAECPLVEVDRNARVLWMNDPANARMRRHAFLTLSAGRLHPRNRDCQAMFLAAINQTFETLDEVHCRVSAERRASAVSLGEDDAAVPQFCWVILEDGKVLVSFDDDATTERRLATAAGVYELSPAQARLAALIVRGSDLAAAAASLGVSISTTRTQLKRMFDKTGTHSQVALVRALLSVQAPIG